MITNNQLEEVFNLIRQTGDRCIILSESYDPFVIMDINNYRSLLKIAAKTQHVSSLTEEELLDKINLEIVEWKKGQRELDEYDLSQFRVDSIRKDSTSARRNADMRIRASQQQAIENLPIIEENQSDSDSDEEYHLEPLG